MSSFLRWSCGISGKLLGQLLRSIRVQGDDHLANAISTVGAGVIHAFNQQAYHACLLGRLPLLPGRRQQRRYRSLLVENALELLEHKVFHRGRSYRGIGTGMPTQLLGAGADVITVAATAVFGGMRRRHGPATRPAMEQSLEQGSRAVTLFLGSSLEAQKVL